MKSNIETFYPGSFDPLHHGHMAIVSHYETCYPDREVTFCRTYNNVDKPRVSYEDMGQIEMQFANLGRKFISLNKGATFISMHQEIVSRYQYMGKPIAFIIGMDTFDRLLTEKYYFNNHEMNRVFNYFTNQDVIFHVYPRAGYHSTMSKSDIYDKFKDRFVIQLTFSPIDVSSSQIKFDSLPTTTIEQLYQDGQLLSIPVCHSTQQKPTSVKLVSNGHQGAILTFYGKYSGTRFTQSVYKFRYGEEFFDFSGDTQVKVIKNG